MLSRDLRLLSFSIPPLLRRGIRIHTDAIDFLYQKHPTEKRFACIISSKVEKHAVERNHTKRLVHSALQVLLPDMTCGVLGAFVVRRKLPRIQEDVTTSIRAILCTAGVIQP